MAGVNQDVKTYDLGQTVEVEAWFTIDGERIAPDVVIKVRKPDGTVLTPTVTPRTDADQQPYFTAEVVADLRGVWHYRAEATQAGDVGPFEHYFRVNTSVFA